MRIGMDLIVLIVMEILKLKNKQVILHMLYTHEFMDYHRKQRKTQFRYLRQKEFLSFLRIVIPRWKELFLMMNRATN